MWSGESRGGQGSYNLRMSFQQPVGELRLLPAGLWKWTLRRDERQKQVNILPVDLGWSIAV